MISISSRPVPPHHSASSLYTTIRYVKLFRLTKPSRSKDWGKRFRVMLTVAFGQSRSCRKPVVGPDAGLVWWGFLCPVGSIEMVIDGLIRTNGGARNPRAGLQRDHCFGDIFAMIIIFALIAFMIRAFHEHRRSPASR